MADIRKLDGSPLDTEAPGRNEDIARLLDSVTKRNEAGRLRACCVIYITESGCVGSGWHWAAGSGDYPWWLAMHGAVHMAAGEMDAKWRELPEVDETPPTTAA